MDYLEDVKTHLMDCPEDTIKILGELINEGLIWLQYKEMKELAYKSLEEDASADLETILSSYDGLDALDILSQLEKEIDLVTLRVAKSDEMDWILEEIQEEE